MPNQGPPGTAEATARRADRAARVYLQALADQEPRTKRDVARAYAIAQDTLNAAIARAQRAQP